jgi:hypothetical protein
VTDDTRGGTGGERPLTDEERARLYREQVKRLHTVDLVRAMLADVVTLAYQKLGLTAETADLRDLGDVRAAIETLRRLVEVLDSEGALDEARTYRSTLAALQLQFAAAAAAPSPEPGAPAPGSGPVRPAGGAGSEAPDEPEPATGTPARKTQATKAQASKAPPRKAPPRKTSAKKTPAGKKPPAGKRPSATKARPPKKGSGQAGS